MNDLETRLRTALEHRVGAVSHRTMPPGTLARIRGRQALFSAGVGLVLLALLVAGLALFRMKPGPPLDPFEPASHEPPRSILEEVPSGWPSVDIRDVGTAYRPSTAEYHALDTLRVIATGTAEGHGFSYLAWTGSTDDDGTRGPCILFAGPGPVDPTPDAGAGAGGPVVSTCAQHQESVLPEAADLYLLGQQAADAEGVGANLGFVSARVRDLEVALGDGARHRIPLLRGPDGWGGVRAFLFFPPAHTEGTLLAFDDGGALLSRARICSFEAGFSGSCAGQAQQLASVPSSSS